MIRHQSLDISTPEARLTLADAAKEAALQLGTTLAAMTAFLVAHCRLEDLFYPGSH